MKNSIENKIEALQFIIGVSKEPKTDIDKDRDSWQQSLLESLKEQLAQEQKIKKLETALLKVQDDMEINVRLIKQTLNK